MARLSKLELSRKGPLRSHLPKISQPFHRWENSSNKFTDLPNDIQEGLQHLFMLLKLG